MLLWNNLKIYHKPVFLILIALHKMTSVTDTNTDSEIFGDDEIYKTISEIFLKQNIKLTQHNIWLTANSKR